MSPSALATAVVAAAPDPAPDRARELLSRELRGPDYQEPWAERALRWFSDLVDRLGDAAAGSGPLGVVGAVVLLVLLVAVLGFALSRLRRDGGRDAGSAPVFAATRRTSLEHRQAARQALDEGRFDDAVVESVRALTVGLVERDLLADAVGLTVLEATRAAGARFPGLAGRLDALRADFDDVRYGDGAADRASAERALEVDREVAAATPSSGPSRPADAAVPS